MNGCRKGRHAGVSTVVAKNERRHNEHFKHRTARKYLREVVHEKFLLHQGRHREIDFTRRVASRKPIIHARHERRHEFSESAGLIGCTMRSRIGSDVGVCGLADGQRTSFLRLFLRCFFRVKACL